MTADHIKQLMIKSPSRYIKRLLAIFISLLCLSCSQEPQQPFRIGTNNWPGYEPLYLARHNQYWENQNIKLTEYPNNTEVLRSFRNRSIEAACVTLDEALLLKQYQIDFKIILITDISNGGDVIISRPYIQSVKELDGKRIGVESSALGAYVITRALELNDLDINQIQIKHLPVDKHISAYSDNEIDAVVTFEPIRTQLLAGGAREIFSSKEIPGEIVDVMLVRTESIQKHNKQLIHVLKGWFKAVDDLKTNSKDSAKIISKRIKISAKDVIASYDGLKLPNLDDNKILIGGKQPIMLNNIQYLRKVMTEQNLLHPDTNTQDLLDASLLNQL